MIQTVRITKKSETDLKGQGLLADIIKLLNIKTIKNIKTAKVYRLEGIDKQQGLKIANEVLFEPLNQSMSFNAPALKGADKLIEISYKPGVMNPEAASIIKASRDIGINLKAADSSVEYAFFGNITQTDLEKITKKFLVNATVQHVVTKDPNTLMIKGESQKVKTIPIRKLSEVKLMALAKKGLYLNLEEMKIIQNYFNRINRDPTDCELEVLAQTWSEHCGHKTFKAKLIIDGKRKEPLFTRIKSTAKNNSKLIVSAFVDNSGVIDFYDGYAINGKVETHNSPSAIEPYGGAMTGSGGVFRDILGTGQGAKVISSTDIFCLAPWDLPQKDLPPGCLPPDYIFKQVIYGIRDYGNRVGIPTNNGSVHFHAGFKAKPTVAAGAFGIIPKAKSKKQQPQKGDLILTLGGRTGRDGIHGATFSSGVMTHKTIGTSGSAVQIGNALEEKRVIDAVLAMRDQNLIRSITDCGAGGFSSAIGEMGEPIGAHVYLEKALLKYTGLAPWEIFVSESQERMILAISPKNIKKALEVCKLYNVEGTVLGQFDGSKRLKVTFNSQKVCDLDMKFLHNGLPQREMIGTTAVKNIKNKQPKPQTDLVNVWQKIMSHGNVASKESIVRMYDHNVQGTSALHPFSGVHYDGPNDGAIVRPILEKPYGAVISHGLNPAMMEIDPYWGSIWAITEAVSNFVSIGGDISDAALIDNFVWPFPDVESLADLDKAVDACVKMSDLLNMPFISGKDSLSSTYRYPDGKILKIPPVLLISVFGRIPDVKKTQSADFKKKNSTIVLVGKPDIESLGGTTYFDVTQSTYAQIPKPDLKSLAQVLNSITKGIKNGDILACHDVSEGGIAAALSEMCFGGGIGAVVNMSKIANTRPDFILFNETSGTFLVEVESESVAKRFFGNLPHYILGKTTAEQSINIKSPKTIFVTDLKKLKETWQKPIREVFFGR
jgi:phosphoribosylformylglycinamidine synthase